VLADPNSRELLGLQLWLFESERNRAPLVNFLYSRESGAHQGGDKEWLQHKEGREPLMIAAKLYR
jgi:hypothetical protein